MINLDKILVAFDLSDYSVKAFKYGCDLAEEMKADLIIANVINQGERVAKDPKATFTSAMETRLCLANLLV